MNVSVFATRLSNTIVEKPPPQIPRMSQLVQGSLTNNLRVSAGLRRVYGLSGSLSPHGWTRNGQRSTIRVLNIGDAAYILEISKLILEMKEAHQEETASSVDEAFEKMRENEYDVVVSDYQMPGKDGLQFQRES